MHLTVLLPRINLCYKCMMKYGIAETRPVHLLQNSLNSVFFCNVEAARQPVVGHFVADWKFNISEVSCKIVKYIFLS